MTSVLVLTLYVGLSKELTFEGFVSDFIGTFERIGHG